MTANLSRLKHNRQFEHDITVVYDTYLYNKLLIKLRHLIKYSMRQTDRQSCNYFSVDAN